MKILLIEDEKRLSEAVSYILKEKKHDVDAVYDGEDGYYYIMTGAYDLIILDVNLPKMNGFDVLKRIRNEGNKSVVLMLTALSEVDDLVKGLDLGADDYLPKPFETKELLARVNALSRRKTSYETNIKKYGDLEYDSETLKLDGSSKSVTLTNLEGKLLDLLLTRVKMITPKEMIISKLWTFDSDADDNNVEVYISFLRKKLKYLNSNVSIKTTRNVGYSLEVIDV